MSTTTTTTTATTTATTGNSGSPNPPAAAAPPPPNYSFCDAVNNANPLNAASQKCADPSATGVCPAAAISIANNNDQLRRLLYSTSDPVLKKKYTDMIISRNQSMLDTMYSQYGVNVSNVEWEDIQAQCRNEDGTKKSRAQLGQLTGNNVNSYNADGRGLWFSTTAPDGSARPLPKWVATVQGSGVLDTAGPMIPLWFDRWFPPGASFVFGLLMLTVVVLVLALALRRLARPDEKITVVPTSNSSGPQFV